MARRAAVEYRKHGIEIDPSCTVPVSERCYPIGGAAFHLLGDAPGRRNWSATNTSYVERDTQDRLRGFHDHRELLPLLRHRYEPDHPEVTAFLNRKRDIRLTVDASLQIRVARILSKYAQRSASRHAAAVVIDPDTGHVLASVSYPFPGAPGDQNGESSDATESLLDRARYGLYPPGSTFKLVTAAAALRLDNGAGGATFMCTKVAGGRVGTRIPGWGLVRDDVLDAHPHGTINLHDAIVQSCNAYFAQLAVRLGPQPILDTAALVGVSVARDGSVGRLRATLPQAGYGQGDVVSTPLRMARIAAAIAGDGILREPRLESRPSDNAQTHTLLTPDAAAHLGILRDAVLTGTADPPRPPVALAANRRRGGVSPRTPGSSVAPHARAGTSGLRHHHRERRIRWPGRSACRGRNRGSRSRQWAHPLKNL